MILSQIGKWFALAGGVLIVIGGLLWLAAKAGIPLGRLPGDFRIDREQFSLHVPLGTCLLISILLTLFLNIVWRLFR